MTAGKICISTFPVCAGPRFAKALSNVKNIMSNTIVAYIPALTIRECPHCMAHVVQEDTLSGNTIGATYWTDGKREAKMLPNHHWLAKCPICAGLFWVDEAVEVDTGFEAAEGKRKVLAPSEKNLLGFLDSPTLDRDEELYLRVTAWRSANDAWRWKPNATMAFSKEQAQNLHALSEMLDEKEPHQQIMKAEIAREMGEFRKCLRLLSHPFDKDYYHAASFIRMVAEEKTQAVRQFLPFIRLMRNFDRKTRTYVLVSESQGQP